MSKKNKKDRKIFSVIYISILVLFFVLAIVLSATGDFNGKALIKKFGAPFFAIVYCIVSFVEGLLTYSGKRRKVFVSFLCIGNACIFMLSRFVASDIITFLTLALNTVLPVYYLFYYFRYKMKFPNGLKADLIKSTVVAMLLPWVNILFSISICRTLDDGLLFAYTGVLAGVLTVVAGVLFLTVYKRVYLELFQTLYERILTIFGAVLFTFIYSFVVIGCVNTGFSSERHIGQYEIVDKKVLGGGKAPRKPVICVKYNGKEMGIEVSSEVYRNKEIGETLIVYTYSGFLSIPYVRTGE